METRILHLPREITNQAIISTRRQTTGTSTQPVPQGGFSAFTTQGRKRKRVAPPAPTEEEAESAEEPELTPAAASTQGTPAIANAVVIFPALNQYRIVDYLYYARVLETPHFSSRFACISEVLYFNILIL